MTDARASRPGETLGERRVGRRSEQKRRWDRDNRPACACGALMSSHASRCSVCESRDRANARALRRAIIADAYRDGRSLREIADALGTTVNTIGTELTRMRAGGYDLPYRYVMSDGRRVTA